MKRSSTKSGVDRRGVVLVGEGGVQRLPAPATALQFAMKLVVFVEPAQADAGAEGSADVALPFARGFRQPLAAAYRVGLAQPITALLAAGGRTPGELFARCRVTVLDDAALRADPAVARLDLEAGYSYFALPVQRQRQ